ncbi:MULTISPECIES: methyltransferase domain-containing protein [Streptococcus]|uniref:23S_rRNA m1G745 methyltransferase n=1 Tax=Streptococcus viridans TaxID=78535 RepID=A0A447Z2B2_9STRE|nr:MULTISPECIES: methyltransferase domain-containing protein [Streptococcus]VED66420.1 23S_rRNA m1G745 methyltransferase [Streptococcus viridans]VEE18724.1 23S_rRNA m1G745 methyltransferase [Streptococcus australis]
MTIKPKLQRFQTATAFACPICQEALDLVQQSLACPNRHSFDLAKFGYVNLAPQVKASKDYDKENFQNRQLVLENGFYDHILNALSECLSPLAHPVNILDIGCGEGYYSRSLQERHPDHSFYAFDLSKESIQLAAKSDQEWKVKWFVGDLAHLPLLDQSMDLLLDIFSPANYQEFKRVLAPDGRLIKVIPTATHLQEIRQKVKDHLDQVDYSNEQIIQHFSDHFTIENTIHCQERFELTPALREALLSMTPLLFHVDPAQIDWTDLTQVTISATILIGRSN